MLCFFPRVQLGERESDSSNGLSLLSFFFAQIFFFFFFAPLFPSPPALCMPVSSSSSSCCFARATGICSSSARMLFFLQPFFPILYRILQSIYLLCIFHFSFFLFFSFFTVWLVLFAIVLGTLAFHLLYLDEVRLFGLLCFTACDHTICFSLSRMKNRHGPWVY